MNTPTVTVAAITSMLTMFWPLNRNERLISPCSLPKATRLPLNEIAPISAPTTASVDMVSDMCSPRYSSTAAIAAAAPPPKPL